MTPSSPPSRAIRAAVEAGARSPCAKSKRGAVIFSETAGRVAIYAAKCNQQPQPFVCSGDERCRAACAKLCTHAEQAAILSAVGICGGSTLRGLQLVHAKVVNRLLVPGGGPSCWQCSRLVLEVALDGVWLYEGPDGRKPEHYQCTACSEVMTRSSDFEEYQHAGCLGLVERVGAWRYYTAEDFHRATLAACGIEVPR